MKEEFKIGYTLCTLEHLVSRTVLNTPAIKSLETVTGKNGWIIKYLYDNRENKIYQKDIEKKFSLRRSSVSKMLDQMQEKNLIERVDDEDDARLKRIVLTENACRIHRIISEDIERTENRLSSLLTKEEIRQLKAITDKLKNALEEKQ